MVHAAVAVGAPGCAERHAELAANAARHDGQRVWAELFLVLLRQRGKARLAPLRALGARRAAAPQALLQAVLGLLQVEAEGGGAAGSVDEACEAGEGGEGGEGERRLAACIASAKNELGSSLLTALALTAVARRAGTGDAAAEGHAQGHAERGGGKRRRSEDALDALNAALILAARMQDAHTQCAVLTELAQQQQQQPQQPVEELPQADEYGQHLRAKRQAIDDAVGSARRSAAFEALFGPDGL